jgi:hypothetical protein
MLQHMKSRDGVGPRCLVSLAESLDATRKNVMLLFRPLSNAADQAALTRSLNQCNAVNAAPILLQEKVAVNGANFAKVCPRLLPSQHRTGGGAI